MFAFCIVCLYFCRHIRIATIKCLQLAYKFSAHRLNQRRFHFNLRQQFKFNNECSLQFHETIIDIRKFSIAQLENTEHFQGQSNNRRKRKKVIICFFDLLFNRNLSHGANLSSSHSDDDYFPIVMFFFSRKLINCVLF